MNHLTHICKKHLTIVPNTVEGWVDTDYVTSPEVVDEVFRIIPSRLVQKDQDDRALIITTKINRDFVGFHTDDMGWCALYCVEGSGDLMVRSEDVYDEVKVTVREGDWILFDDREPHAFQSLTDQCWIVVLLLKAFGWNPPRSLKQLKFKHISCNR